MGRRLRDPSVARKDLMPSGGGLRSPGTAARHQAPGAVPAALLCDQPHAKRGGRRPKASFHLPLDRAGRKADLLIHDVKYRPAKRRPECRNRVLRLPFARIGRL